MKILCFGDSNTYGYDPCSFLGGRYPAESRWVDILATNTGWDVINRGENGREIPRREGELQRFRQEILEKSPGLLVVMLGGNDLLQGAAPAEAAARMEHLLGQASALKPEQILLIGPPPKQLGAWVPNAQLVRDSVELARQYGLLAERLGICFADAGQWNIQLTYDGVHYTPEGHRAFAAGIQRAIEEILSSRKEQQEDEKCGS